MSCLDLLSEPLITVRLSQGEERGASLPEVLERLSNGEDLDFRALRTHQQHPWYAFLVQLAAMTLFHSKAEFQATSAAQWEEYLLGLAGGSREAFCLVVKDLSKPAFFQPPVPEGNLAQFKKQLGTPDELDMLVTAKNHDLKAARMERARPEHWLFSVMTLQTMEGFLGAGNYGIARMNGGFASRPFVTYASSLGWKDRFCRDVKVLLSKRSELVNLYGYEEFTGKTLLWLDLWDGASSLELHECDPFFIEICRRVRLITRGDGLVALARPTTAPRIAQRDKKGNTGDPWTPVVKGDAPKALNVTSSGFGYDLTQRLICSSDFMVGATQQFQKGDPDAMLFVANVLARKQGGTEGLHERVVPIPRKAKAVLSNVAKQERLEGVAKQRVADVAKWKRDVLRFALCALSQGKFSDLDLSDQKIKPALSRLDERVDRIFFESLWHDLESIEASSEQASLEWNKLLMQMAKEILEQAADSMGIPSNGGYRNRAFAKSVFEIRARKHFQDLFPTKEEKAHE